jgi:Zn-dependent protease/CBS domain-containing protein
MKWSLKLGSYAGIPIHIHLTFFLLVGWLGMVHWTRGKSLEAVVAGVGFILVLFACVLLHEFGHALTAKKYGIKTRDITLLPIGGVARLERMPDNPMHELWVALAGPAVNVVIAAALFVWLLFTASLEPLKQLTVTTGSFIERIMVVNVFLAVFNMLPAFPMDGGRVLRALLAMRTDYTRATQIAANVGQGMAFVFGFIGLFSNPFLLFIALFVWIGAAQEASMVQMKSSIGGIPVKRSMLTDFRTLLPHHTVAHAVELTLAGSQKDFPVVQDGRVLGILTQNDLLAALTQKGQDTAVSEVMQQEFTTVDSFDMLETAFRQLRDCRCHTLAVTHKGTLVGLLTMDNVGEFIRIQAAVRGTTSPQLQTFPSLQRSSLCAALRTYFYCMMGELNNI